jgi:hypothetical protein
VLNVAMMMSLKFQQNITNPTIPNDMVDDVIGGYSNVKLVKLVVNIKM